MSINRVNQTNSHMKVREFIKTLYSSKQELVIDGVWIYALMKEGMKADTYNVIINIDRLMGKKAKRLGLVEDPSKFAIIKPLRVSLDLSDSVEMKGTSLSNQSRIIIIYNNRTKDVDIYEGESTEEHQIQSIRDGVMKKRWSSYRSHRRY